MRRLQLLSISPLPRGAAGPDMVQATLWTPTVWQDDIRVDDSARAPEWITLEVRCKIDAADRTTHFIREMSSEPALRRTCGRYRQAAGSAKLLMNGNWRHGGKNDPREACGRAFAAAGTRAFDHRAISNAPGSGLLDGLSAARGDLSNPDEFADGGTWRVRAEGGASVGRVWDSG